jgi:hypothetical protein
MIKHFKYSTVLVAILLLTSITCSFAPTTQAAQENIQEKSVLALNSLANIDTDNYYLSTKQQQDFFLNMLRQTVELTLTGEDNLRVSCSFVDERLQQIFVADRGAEKTVLAKADSAVDAAKDFMQRYQTYTKDSFYGNLNSMLNTVNAGENVSKVTGNVKLDVNLRGQDCLDFVWTYVDAGGVEAPAKNVILTYEYGDLKCFVDNWQLYTVAGTPTINEKQAVEFALNVSAGFSLSAVDSNGENVTISGFKVASVGEPALVYLNFHEVESARANDPFVLFPCWYVPLGFDKAYFGDITGLYVRLWADTGEISDISLMTVSDASSFSEPSAGEAITSSVDGAQEYQ